MHMTYTLNSTPVLGTVDDDGMAKYELRDTERPDTLICYMTLPVDDAAFWAKLLNSQAEKAWELGRIAGNRSTVQPNPYTIRTD